MGWECGWRVAHRIVIVVVMMLTARLPRCGHVAMGCEKNGVGRWVAEGRVKVSFSTSDGRQPPSRYAERGTSRRPLGAWRLPGGQGLRRAVVTSGQVKGRWRNANCSKESGDF